MLALGIETSTRSGSVALAHADHTELRALKGERAHASDLVPAIEHLLNAHDLAPRSIELVVVGIGPGSYTGLRIGIATALGLVRATGAELVGVSSFEALAWHALGDGESGDVVLDARAGSFYFARYARTEEDLMSIVEPCVLSADELEERCTRDGRILALSRIDVASIAHERVERGLLPRADALLALGTRAYERDGSGDSSRVRPLYLREFVTRNAR